MFAKKNRWLVLALFITILLAGCRCDNSVIPTYYGIADTPANGEVTSLTPSFNWHGSDSCDPDEYIFNIAEGGIPTLGLVNTNIGPGALPYTYVGGVGSDLEPGKSYTWSLTAVNGSNGGDPPVFGPKTEVGQFFTGPICSGEALVAPELLEPEPAGWVEDDPYLFKWTYEGGCLPESYQIQFALDPGFTNISMTANTTDPYAQEKLMTFLDCSTLFWRVRAYDGTSYGPWSAGRDFHYILSGNCWQWHYESEDFAWINVRLYKDYCPQTGAWAATVSTPDPGCVVDGSIIVGDGTGYGTVSDYVVDLGSGPCPSTGLDQKIASNSAKFGVVTPGTYCLSISRNQVADGVNLMSGIWTDPRVNAVVLEKTLDLGPGTHDLYEIFRWDELEYSFLTLPLEFTYNCKFGPDDNCPTIDYAQAGEMIPIFARDRRSEWYLTELREKACYIRLPGSLLDKYFSGGDNGVGKSAADLQIFPPPPPCPEPEGKKTCFDYLAQGPCEKAGCTWYRVNDTTTLCIP